MILIIFLWPQILLVYKLWCYIRFIVIYHNFIVLIDIVARSKDKRKDASTSTSYKINFWDFYRTADEKEYHLLLFVQYIADKF